MAAGEDCVRQLSRDDRARHFFHPADSYSNRAALRRTLFSHRWLLWIFVISVVGAEAANELGWAAACTGRQPWVVYPRVMRDSTGNMMFDEHGFIRYHTEEGLLTLQAVSEAIRPGQVLASIIMFSMIYLLLLAVWLYVLNHKIQTGPEEAVMPATTTGEAFITAAAGRIDHEQSMTEAKEPDRNVED